MATIGTLGIYDVSNSLVYTIGFFNLEFPDGWPWDVYPNVVEPLTAMGVNNTRMRIIRTDAPRFRMIGLSEASSFDSATILSNNTKPYVGYLGQLAFTAAGVAYTFTDRCFIWKLDPKPYPCQIASTIALSTSKGLVRTEFELQFTKV